jgi:hypothetical protein
VLVLSICTDHEKAVMVQSDCELGTTTAGGMAESRIASFQCKARTLAPATSILLISSACMWNHGKSPFQYLGSLWRSLVQTNTCRNYCISICIIAQTRSVTLVGDHTE